MKNSNSPRHFLFTRGCALGAILAVFVTLGAGCETGGKEGDRCNPLVLRDECNANLHCKRASCSEAYCCPTDRTSTDPHCNAEGCPDTDAGDQDASADAAGGEGGSDAAGSDGGNDAGGSDGGSDAAADSQSDAPAGDAADSG